MSLVSIDFGSTALMIFSIQNFSISACSASAACCVEMTTFVNSGEVTLWIVAFDPKRVYTFAVMDNPEGAFGPRQRGRKTRRPRGLSMAAILVPDHSPLASCGKAWKFILSNMRACSAGPQRDACRNRPATHSGLQTFRLRARSVASRAIPRRSRQTHQWSRIDQDRGANRGLPGCERPLRIPSSRRAPPWPGWLRSSPRRRFFPTEKSSAL